MKYLNFIDNFEGFEEYDYSQIQKEYYEEEF